MSIPARRPASDGEVAGLRRTLLLLLAPAMVLGLGSGLARILPSLGCSALLAVDHGALLVMGVFGSVIAVERATALESEKVWPLCVPAASIAGAWLLVFGSALAPPMLLLGSVGLATLDAVLLRRQCTTPAWVMLLASVALSVSAGLRLVDPSRDVTPLWLAFFVGTILAERLELSRLAPRPRWAEPLLIALLGVQLAAAAAAACGVALARLVVGTTFLLAATWSARFDIATRLAPRGTGLPRFAAWGVLLALVWLGVSGAVMVVTVALEVAGAGPLAHGRDAYLHALLVGFVLSMVLAHALLILPAVARIGLRFSAVLYVPLAMLHASVALRVAADLVSSPALKASGGVGHALALATFVVCVVLSQRKRTPEGLG